MNSKKLTTIFCVIKQMVRVPLALLILSSMTYAESSADIRPDKIVTYKVINDSILKLHIFNPQNHKSNDYKPAIVFFFGGGWSGGSPEQFYDQSKYLASRGMVAISAEYRIRNIHNTSPKEIPKR
ncbi:carboxylesterase family protein [Paraglaciecola aquimarina]|uniref:Carboxylesterase family protein n=1 Tax=Paraglaciecola aquimarina TaxID=1235557 RepID=A0ABU3STJ0_9ALTE|nr:carboxylesterase family protein [Paraglaciecola aquimarina]MDU0353277.1 carboxylesterase family protein [Paraglaciecola aquimarina]